MQMISIYDVLKASKGIHVDDTFAELWGRKLSNAYTVDTYSGTLPATLQTVEGYLKGYKIYGNTEQNGTPTPENPIIPSRCGEIETTGIHAGQYKLPILSNSTVTNIYLGEVETTRRIKKLVLTGDETVAGSTLDGGWIVTNLPTNMVNTTDVITASCSHYKAVNNASMTALTTGDMCISTNIPNRINFATDISTAADFKSYLAAQYANGTPVTVWYVLAKLETGIVNEPLMKIGDYADTIDSTQAMVQIPTAAGETTVSWAGEGLAPSEVELTYRKPKGQ